jgi:bifunctional UDP-N-acetylglucosamine pyrophosphorylase/glucosamine-1-phosphate N-acetyltransferase
MRRKIVSKRYAVVLAAGQGTRMKSKLYKVMHPVMGKPMVGHIVDAAQAANVDRVVTVTGVGAETVQEYLGDKSEYVLQEEQLGTAHAVKQAEDLLSQEEGTTLVLCGDTPLLKAETIEALFAFHEKEGAKATVLTAHATNPFGYGRVIRSEDNSVAKIVEQKDATEEEQAVQEINTGTYCFDNKALFETLREVKNENAQGEYYLPDVVEILKEKQELVTAFQLDTMDEALGVNDRVALAEANRLMKERINEAHMRNGVTFVDPSNTYIESDVTIGADTVIEPGVYLKGNTSIGEDAFIGTHSVIQDSQLGNNVVVKSSTLEEAVMGDGSDIGPNSRLRPGAVLKENVHIGNYVEVKQAVLGKGTKAGHHAYIGNAEVGEDVNISCGVIFVNYDGQNKHKAVVGDHAFIGSNASVIAPITIEDHAFVAAGSTVNKNVPKDALAIARARQENKEGYAQKLPYYKDK